MAKKVNPEQEVQETEAIEETSVPVMDARDAEIEELRAQLAAARRQSESYRAGRDAEVVENAIKEALAANKDPWDITISVRVPERRDTSEKSYWICVNGRSAQIPANNQYQEMRLPFAEALMKTLQADRYAQKFADESIQIHDPISNPHPGN